MRPSASKNAAFTPPTPNPLLPENGGSSVFNHEYGHDLGLPDLYNRAGTGDTENSVNWWSLMAPSRVDGPRDVGLGQR